MVYVNRVAKRVASTVKLGEPVKHRGYITQPDPFPPTDTTLFMDVNDSPNVYAFFNIVLSGTNGATSTLTVNPWVLNKTDNVVYSGAAIKFSGKRSTKEVHKVSTMGGLPIFFGYTSITSASGVISTIYLKPE